MKENYIKNLLVIPLVVIFYPVLNSSLSRIRLDQMNDFLIIISVLLVTVCFANFAFTYEKSQIQHRAQRYLSHTATFLFLLLTAFLLESIVFAVKVVYPSFYGIIFFFAILIYVGVALYDFWDLLRAEG